ncbi:uncharacterized protein LOC127834978 [Dreissena polymorpha]|uniref:Short-chain collagen C4-like n=1 Tax=Dreissena polymorpha TaxID=45954 RepID=A0A9D4JDB7_DREPO|nr:uncharacterized protein LOC127834978 [Dreissena polymorpha]KAH3807575.1 hypothetical protein DPMN_135920 [Dreissena polymorpha]
MHCMRISRLIVLFLLVRWSSGTKDKRLVLHSDEDTAAAIQALTARIEQLVAQNNRHESEIQALKSGSVDGSVYTRWGRTSCPQNGSELIYAGYIGGNGYNTNGAADYICLSGDPLWGVYDDSAHPYALKIHGTEYQFAQQFSNGGAQFFGQNLQDHDAPCAVCRSSRTTNVMIPGRNQCYPGWTMEYWGYLVSGYYTHSSPTNYACLDANAEWEVGDGDDRDGKLMYLVEAACGSLKCPPYVEKREITCVVCSK